MGEDRRDTPTVGGLAIAATGDSLLDQVGLAYEAAVEPSLWQEGAACDFVAAVVGFGIVDHRGDRLLSSYWNDKAFARGVRAFYPTPLSNPAVVFAARTSPLAVADALTVPSDLERLDFYDEVMRPRAPGRGDGRGNVAFP